VTSVRFEPLRGLMDARVKPAHDAECVESAVAISASWPGMTSMCERANYNGGKSGGGTRRCDAAS
jgi:hypothetical protein